MVSFAPTRKMIFDGKRLAYEKEKKLQERVRKPKEKSITPKLVAILVGDNPASKQYVSYKKKAAKRIGIEVEIVKFDKSVSIHRCIDTIVGFNEDDSVHGIMIQLPLPENLRLKTKNLIQKISSQKDVDGLREDSKFIHPTVRAVFCAMEEAEKSVGNIVRPPLRERPCKVVVVGSRGMVGRPLIKELKKAGYDVTGCHSQTKNIKAITKKADILISAAGVPGLIKADMVEKGAVVVDVGSPKGDVDFDSVSKKASFITPVPGGIGPLTVYYLLENLVNILY